MTDNTRIRTDALGNRVERIATETHIFYSPLDKSANIVFQGEEHLTSPDGETVVSKLEGRQALAVSLSAIAAKTYDAGTDPVTGADLSKVSPAGIAQIIRAVYDAEHNLAHAVVEPPAGA
jgi:hypothetical protein